jgi:hypothetical protein
MLEDLNNILNSGDVPNIYQSDELDNIYIAMRGPTQEAGLPINKSNLFSTYLRIIRNNLHTMITMRYSYRNISVSVFRFIQPTAVYLFLINNFDSR